MRRSEVTMTTALPDPVPTSAEPPPAQPTTTANAPEPLLALTLHPEWAGAICHLGKDCENRTWEPPGPLPRWIAIHAGATTGGTPGIAGRVAALEVVTRTALRAGWKLMRGGTLAHDESGQRVRLTDLDAQRSAIVAVVRIASFDTKTRSAWDAAGQVHWRADAVVVLAHPIPAVGRQKLWAVDAATDETLRLAIRSAEEMPGAPVGDGPRHFTFTDLRRSA